MAMDGKTVLKEAAAAYQATLGDRLLGAYGLGSLAHGGFSELVSDIDLGLVVSDPIRPDDAARIAAIAMNEKAKGSDLHARLSVFWGTPSTLRGENSGGRFPALDRLDLIENGQLLAGSDNARQGLPRPSSEELIVTGAEFALGFLAGTRPSAAAGSDVLASMHFADQDTIKEIRSPQLLVGRGVRRVTKIVLLPARFLYTAMTGQVGTNDAAADYYLSSRTAPGKELIAAARAWRTGATFDEAAAHNLLQRHIMSLYLHYIDDHLDRLEDLGQDEFVALFRHWRERLQA